MGLTAPVRKCSTLNGWLLKTAQKPLKSAVFKYPQTSRWKSGLFAEYPS
jgi:hypothetical protein